MNTPLNEFSEWSKIWFINFNAIKCMVLRIREAIRYIYTLDGVNLESVDSQKDLGVTISKTLKPATHMDIITNKAYQKIGIKQCFTNFTEVKNPWYKLLSSFFFRMYFPSVQKHLLR